jgi:hypothetical protein
LPKAQSIISPNHRQSIYNIAAPAPDAAGSSGYGSHKILRKESVAAYHHNSNPAGSGFSQKEEDEIGYYMSQGNTREQAVQMMLRNHNSQITNEQRRQSMVQASRYGSMFGSSGGSTTGSMMPPPAVKHHRVGSAVPPVMSPAAPDKAWIGSGVEGVRTRRGSTDSVGGGSAGASTMNLSRAQQASYDSRDSSSRAGGAYPLPPHSQYSQVKMSSPPPPPSRQFQRPAMTHQDSIDVSGPIQDLNDVNMLDRHFPTMQGNSGSGKR